MNVRTRIISSLCSIILPGALSLAGAGSAAAQVVSATLAFPKDIKVFGVAVNEVTNKAYVAVNPPDTHNYAQPQGVYVIDGVTNAMTPVAGTVDAMVLAVNPVTNRIYSANADAHLDVSNTKIQVIDGSTKAVTSFVLDPSVTDISQLFVDPAANVLYAAATASTMQGPIQEIFAVSGSTNTVTSTIALPLQVTQFAADLAHSKIYGINGVDSSLYIVDLTTRAVTQVPGAPSDSKSLAIAIDSPLNKINVLNALNSITNGGTVAVFDGATGSLQATRSVGKKPKVMAINPVSHVLFVWNGDSPATITLLAEADLSPYTFNVGSDPGFAPTTIAIDTAANKIYIPDSSSSQYMLVVNGQNFQIAAIDGVTAAVQTMAVNQTTHAVYAVTDNGMSVDGVTIIDGTGGTTAVATVFPKKLKFAATLNDYSEPQMIYVANTGSASMFLINLQFGGAYYPSIIQTNDCYNPILPGQTCPISLVYRPNVSTPTTDSGPYNITVESPGTSTSTSVSTTLMPGH